VSKDIENLQRKAKEESELLLKKKAIEAHKTQADYDRMVRSQQDIDAWKNINIEADRPAFIERVIKESREYMEAAKSCKEFMCKSFNRIVPFFAKNIILMGATSGEGKSTVTANIALKTIMSGGKVLIISNEEAVPDVYNRITCLAKGWLYTNHNEFTDEQKAVLESGIRAWEKYVTVIGDSTYGPGTTTTIEGVQSVMESLIKNGQKYDVIILDYIQKVMFSKTNHYLQTWEILNKMMLYIDDFKNRYMAPIVVMSQLHPSNGESERSFEDRIRGYKGIITPSTCAIEMVANKKDLKTKFVIHKNRWYDGDTGKQTVTVGWFKGKFVDENNPDFKSWVDQKKGERVARMMENENGTRKSND
jgi:hypothetical protein